MALTAFAVMMLSLGSSKLSKRGTSNMLLINLVCMLIPHIVLGGIVVYRIVERASNKFQLSFRNMKLAIWNLFKSTRQAMDTFPIEKDGDTREGTLSPQLTFPTETTLLLSTR